MPKLKTFFSSERRKKEISWILEDCGNSAYALAVDTAIFPLYFALSQNADILQLGYYKGLASLIIALISPVLGTIADYRGYKKKFFAFFNYLGILMTAALAFIPLNDWHFLIIVFILSNIGYAGSNIFYDAFLVDVAENDRMDRVSSRGYAYGYIVSVIPFILCLPLIKILGMENTLGYRLSFLIAALWWFVFSLPLLKYVKQIYYVEPEKNPIRKSFLRLYKTFQDIKSHRIILLFLLSYFFYIDGVNTIFKMVVPFAQSVLGSSFNSLTLLAILLLTQIIAFPCALLFGHLSHRFNCLSMIRFAIFIYLVSTSAAFFMKTMGHLLILSFMIAFALGGIQALSRSYFAKLIPKEKSNEFFGFYSIFGKFAAIMGPMIMAFIDSLTGSPRLTILGVLPLFLIGFILSLFLPKDQGNKDHVVGV